ncbi:hypothetical protein CHS0354_000257 [Potamilus streckersoni]|uniref:Uncharacterized protein n=1 Tax=Potamilus streckersoni TaxID=2493646 RepID=A0AAE0VZ76_9BIVA|nr:hypothetical protein CHS0354_000257 [Potamilus streckersoni]
MVFSLARPNRQGDEKEIWHHKSVNFEICMKRNLIPTTIDGKHTVTQVWRMNGEGNIVIDQI